MPQGRVIKGSLKLKLILSVCITIAFLIGLLTYLIVNIQTDAMLKKTRDSNRMMSQMFYQHLELAMLTGKREEIQRLLQDVGKYEGIITIKIFDETGRIVFCSNPQFIGQKIGLHHTDIFKEENIHGTLDFTEGHEEFHLVTPIKNKNECHRCHGVEKEFMGALDLDISLASMRKAVATNRNVMISFAILTILVVSLVISLFTMKFVSHPVTHLIGTMQEVEKGNLDRRVNLATNDELGMLGESFNSMISKLDEAKKELQVLHESELARADRLASIGELASGIAHEIKNPLAGIGAAIQVISEGIAKDDPQKEVLDEIMKQIERLNKTIKDFLAYARPTEPRMAIYDITDVAKKAVFLIRKQAENQKVTIEENYKYNIPGLLIDPEQVQQVMVNIMLNAVQAMPEGGRLIISAKAEPKFVELSVTDTGKGIPKDNLAKIFTPFYTTKHQGTGLGLSISNRIIEKHNGSIRVESEVGRGTTFNIRLPIKDVQV